MRKILIAAGAVALLIIAVGFGIPSKSNAQPFGGWGMMGGYGYGWGPIGMIIWIVILALVIAAVVWFARTMTQSGPQVFGVGRRSPGLDVLEERYARGEIKREEYLEKKRDITGGNGMTA